MSESELEWSESQSEHYEMEIEEEHPEHKKVKFYEAIKDAKEGDLPPNEQVTEAIDGIQKVINKDYEELSVTGKQVIDDMNNLLRDTNSLIHDKNQGDLIQHSFHHSKQLQSHRSYGERLSELKKILSETDKRKARDDTNENAASVLTILKLSITSPQFRQTMDDGLNILTKLLSRSQKTKEEKQDENQSEEDEGSVEFEVKEDSRNVTRTVRATDGEEEVVSIESGPAVVEKPKTKLSKDKRLAQRMVDFAESLHKNPEYYDAIMLLANSVARLNEFSSSKRKEIEKKKDLDEANQPVSQMAYHKQESRKTAAEFLENWAGEDFSLDAFLRNLRLVVKHSRSDPEFRLLVDDWKKWLKETMTDKDQTKNKDSAYNEATILITRTRMVLATYREPIRVIRKELKYIRDSLQRDDTLLSLRNDLHQIINDIVRDSEGNMVLKPELLKDATIIIHAVLDSLKYLPLPKIVKEDDKMDVVLDNIVFNTTDVAPSDIRFFIHVNTEKGSDGSRQPENLFVLEISKIKANLSNVNFYVNKKRGFPKVCDTGLADIFLSGKKGLSLRIEIAPNYEKREDKNEVVSLFTVKNVQVKISKLKIHVRKSSHDRLYKILAPIINRVIASKIESNLQEYIKKNLNKISSKLVDKASTALEKKETIEDKHYKY